MTFPPGGGKGIMPEAAAGLDVGLPLPEGSGVGVVEGTAEDGRDQPGPVVVLGCGVAVSFAVTRRGCDVDV